MAASRTPTRQVVASRGRILPILLWAGFAAVLLLGGFAAHEYLGNPRNLPLQLIDVRGEFRHLDRANLERVVARSIDGGFFTADIQKIRRAVLGLPWVAEVGISRVWPDRLVMQVKEQVAMIVP